MAYKQSERAKSFVSWLAPQSDLYRIYFNDFSQKIYVDLNGERWAEVKSSHEQELLFCDILRTLLFVLTCQVELYEAREAKKAAEMNAVTSEITEVIIP